MIVCLKEVIEVKKSEKVAICFRLGITEKKKSKKLAVCLRLGR